MKAEAAECVRTAVMLGLDTSELAARGQLVFLEREACRWAAADDAMAGLRRAPAAVARRHAVRDRRIPLGGALGRSARDAQGRAPLRAARARGSPAAAAATRPRARGAAAHRLPLGRFPPARDQPADGADARVPRPRAFEVTLLFGRPRRRQRDAPAASSPRASISRSCAARASRRWPGASASSASTSWSTSRARPTTRCCRCWRSARRRCRSSWLGFPGTTGAPYIDYLIGDAVVTPLAHAAHFSEKIAQLPHCYQPNDARRALPGRRRAPTGASPKDALLLCAFHQSYKISAGVRPPGAGCCTSCPASVLWLLQWNANVRATLTAAAAARGIGADRLVFAPLVPLQDHLSRLAHADVYPRRLALQRPHHGRRGALGRRAGGDDRGRDLRPARRRQPAAHGGPPRAGLPRRRRLPRGRRSRSPRDPARRAALRARLIAARSTTDCSTARPSPRHRALYRRMWQRAVAGERPEHLPAGPAAVVD